MELHTNYTTKRSVIPVAVIAAFAAAAGCFLFDPNSGRRRRARLRDKVTKWSRKTKNFLQKRGRDLSNRTKGLVIEGKKALRKSMNVERPPVKESDFAEPQIRRETQRQPGRHDGVPLM